MSQDSPKREASVSLMLQKVSIMRFTSEILVACGVLDQPIDIVLISFFSLWVFNHTDLLEMAL